MVVYMKISSAPGTMEGSYMKVSQHEAQESLEAIQRMWK